VAAARAMLDETVAYLADQQVELRELTAAADLRAASAAFRAEPLPLRWEGTDASVPFEFLGVAYEEVDSELSGGAYMVFDADQPETFTVDHFNQPQPAVTAELPEAYLVPPEWGVVIARLELHGALVQRLAEPVAIEVRSWRFQQPEWRARPYEGRHPMSFELEAVQATRVFPAGTAVIDLDQPAARALAHGLDPLGPDSFARWGFFDAVMTRVEYVESYVIEPMMQEMLAGDPDLLAELEAAKAADPEFADDPWAIRYWFYERTPYYDQQAFLYPVGCLDDRGVLETLPLR